MNIPKGISVSAITFTQEGDTCSDGDDLFLKVTLEDSGGGKYYVISTERWAFDSIEEIVQLLEILKVEE
jgi:hypothetical protein